MENKNRDIFYGVVAVATLIVALVGATLAYFSISAGSNNGAVSAQGATVSVSYKDGEQVTMQADKLIPITEDNLKSIYEKRMSEITPGSEEALRENVCVDDYTTAEGIPEGRQVCSIYRFSVWSDVERTVTATLNNEVNGFTYLSYAVRDVTNNAWLTLSGSSTSINLSKCDAYDSTDEADNANACYTMEGTKKNYNTNSAVNSIFGLTAGELGATSFTTKRIANTESVYDIVLFIKDNDAVQNEDQGKEYKGTIVVTATEGSEKITGIVKD